MNAYARWGPLVLILAAVLAAPTSFAKEPCYNYLIAYSFKDKAVYHTPVFVQSSKGVSYNEEEFVSDTTTSLKMESAFQKFLQQKMQVSSSDLTVSARVAFKQDHIAKNRLDKEVGDFRFRGFNIQRVPEFRYDE